MDASTRLAHRQQHAVAVPHAIKAWKRILTVATVLTVILNAWYEFGVRVFSNGIQHEVGPAEVSVYPPAEGNAVTKVESIRAHGFVDTGEGVMIHRE